VSATVRRGDVVVVRLDPGEGSEIRKTRPAVVVSNDAACAADAVLQIVPLTAMPVRPLRPYEAGVVSPESRVGKPSRAVANQLRTVARERVARVVGHVTAEELRAIELALAVQLGLPH
jgi:mRNA interferase MazF